MRYLFLRSLNRTNWIHNPEASQGGRHLELAECVGFVFVEVPERAFELFQLCWGQVGHIAGYDLHTGVRQG